MKTHQVFGISPELREETYVDRGNLDEEMRRELARPTHLTIKGPSKSGKSWLRQKVIHNPITVQCRHKKPFTDIYVDALSQLDISIQLRESKAGSFKASLSATGSAGAALLTKVGLTCKYEHESSAEEEHKQIGHDINDLRYVAEIILACGRRLVIEDFHYMSTEDRTGFAFDLKALWDYRVFVVIIGVWSQSNLLLHLNTDLAGRVKEVSLDWNPSELMEIIQKGCAALNVTFSAQLSNKLVELAYSNAGLLQQLALSSLDEAKVYEKPFFGKNLDDVRFVDDASMSVAEQLNPVFQQFAKRVASGVRTRKGSTGIYAHAMAVIIDAPDEELIRGLHARTIYDRAVKRQPRIQYGNLKSILEQIEGLQVDDDGRGLIIGYSQASEEVTIVDRQLLIYRRFSTVKWPWEDLIKEADLQGGQVDGCALASDV